MTTLTVSVPDNLARDLESAALQQHLPLSQYLTQQLELLANNGIARHERPEEMPTSFCSLLGIGVADATDVSVRHDEYL